MRWSHRSDLTVENGLDERSGKCEFKFVDRFMLWIWIFWTRSHFSVQVCNYKYIPNSDISRLDNRCMIQIRLMKANYQSIPFIPDFFFKIKLKSIYLLKCFLIFFVFFIYEFQYIYFYRTNLPWLSKVLYEMGVWLSESEHWVIKKSGNCRKISEKIN